MDLFKISIKAVGFLWYMQVQIRRSFCIQTHEHTERRSFWYKVFN